jgi:hypothetical protein
MFFNQKVLRKSRLTIRMVRWLGKDTIFLFVNRMHGFIFHNSSARLSLRPRALDLYLERSTYNSSARLISRALDLYGDSQKEISRKYSLHDKSSARVISQALGSRDISRALELLSRALELLSRALELLSRALEL